MEKAGDIGVASGEQVARPQPGTTFAANLSDVREIRRQALARVTDKTLPLAIRIRSKETVSLCDERLAGEQS